jgi:adhesin transport system membrane fusion protein
MATNLVVADPEQNRVEPVHSEERHLEDMATRIKPRSASNALLWSVVAFFVIATAWAALTELDRTVHGAGKIVPGSRLQVVTNLEGGIVREILVKAGDVVKKGQPLIRLDSTASGAELSSGESTTGSLAIKIARLKAEVEGQNPVYPNPAGDPGVDQQIGIESALHASRLSDLSSATGAANARINQAQRAVTEAQANYQSRMSSKRAYEQQIGMVRPLVERGIEPRLALVQLENSLSVAQNDAAAAAASIARAQAGVAEAVAAQNQLRQDWRSQAAAELAAAQAEYTARRSALPALQDRVRRTMVLAPLDGRINRVNVATVGGTIGGGAPLLELVPTEDGLIIEATVNPKDIAHVHVGQKARVNVSAYDSAVYGSMDGEVTVISPDSVVDDKTGESHYQVRVRARADTLKNAAGEPVRLAPGMTADVNLLGDKRSILSYLFTPITRLSERALRE